MKLGKKKTPEPPQEKEETRKLENKGQEVISLLLTIRNSLKNKAKVRPLRENQKKTRSRNYQKGGRWEEGVHPVHPKRSFDEPTEFCCVSMWRHLEGRKGVARKRGRKTKVGSV